MHEKVPESLAVTDFTPLLSSHLVWPQKKYFHHFLTSFQSWIATQVGWNIGLRATRRSPCLVIPGLTPTLTAPSRSTAILLSLEMPLSRSSSPPSECVVLMVTVVGRMGEKHGLPVYALCWHALLQLYASWLVTMVQFLSDKVMRIQRLSVFTHIILGEILVKYFVKFGQRLFTTHPHVAGYIFI